MRKKKVLFLIHTLGGGGAEKVLVDLVNNLNNNKYDITVMTIIDVGELRSKLNKDIKYKTTIRLRKSEVKKCKEQNKSGSLLNSGGKFKILMAKIYAKIWKYMPTKIFYKIFIKEKYDIEIAFLEGICAKVISSSNNPNSQKYAWIHVDLINQKKSEGVFKNINDEKNVYSKFNNIVCVSKVVKEQFIKKFDFEPEKVLVKYNAIDKNEIIKKSKEECDYIRDNSFLICSVGRLNAQKAYDRLLRIHKKLIDASYDIKLLIIGEGTAKQELEEYIKENSLENTVKLLGFKSNPYKYIANADLFVCSSIAEGFSTVVSEAIILGIPIVTTECSGMKEMLGSNNEYGIVTENSEEALYIGIKKILDDEKLYKHYKQRIIERKSMFELNRLVERVDKLLEDKNEPETF